MKLMRDQRGMAQSFAVAFGAMIVVAIVWNFFSPVMDEYVFPQSENVSDHYEGTRSWMIFIWRMWPIFMLVGLVIYSFLTAQAQGAQRW